MSRKVFKFRAGNENDLDSLNQDYFWFSLLKDLNDPYEGEAYFDNSSVTDSLRINFLKSIFKNEPKKGYTPEDEVRELYLTLKERFAEHVDERAKHTLKRFYETHRNSVSIFSYSLSKEDHVNFPSPLNNMLMWSHYADGFKGYCVEYEHDLLFESLKKLNDCDLGNAFVAYATDGKLPTVNLDSYMKDHIENSDEPSTLKDIFESFRVKEQSWLYENEARFISNKRGRLNISPNSIKAIYMSEKMPEWKKEAIISMINKKNVGIKIYLVGIHNKKYQLGFRSYPV